MKKHEKLSKKRHKRQLEEGKKIFVRRKLAVINVCKIAMTRADLEEVNPNNYLQLFMRSASKQGWLLIPESLESHLTVLPTDKDDIFVVSCLGVYVGYKRASKHQYVLKWITTPRHLLVKL